MRWLATAAAGALAVGTAAAADAPNRDRLQVCSNVFSIAARALTLTKRDDPEVWAFQRRASAGNMAVQRLIAAQPDTRSTDARAKSVVKGAEAYRQVERLLLDNRMADAVRQVARCEADLGIAPPAPAG
jgi:hypothetical protein